MNSSKLSSIPLQLANLCLDCDSITCANDRCLSCGSSAVLNVARMLNGQERPAIPHAIANRLPTHEESIIARGVNFFHST